VLSEFTVLFLAEFLEARIAAEIVPVRIDEEQGGTTG